MSRKWHRPSTKRITVAPFSNATRTALNGIPKRFTMMKKHELRDILFLPVAIPFYPKWLPQTNMYAHVVLQRYSASALHKRAVSSQLTNWFFWWHFVLSFAENHYKFDDWQVQRCSFVSIWVKIRGQHSKLIGSGQTFFSLPNTSSSWNCTKKELLYAFELMTYSSKTMNLKLR